MSDGPAPSGDRAIGLPGRRSGRIHERPSVTVVTVRPLSDLLADRDFRRLYATRLAGQATDGVFQAGLAGYLLFSPERATTAGSLAAAAAVLLLPYSLVGPVAGIVIDRVPRGRVLVGANVVRSIVVAVLATVALAGSAGVAFYGLALLAFAVNRFILSALSASLPGVTRPDLLVAGNALSTTSGTLATVVGAAIGAGVAAGASAAGAGHDRGQAIAALFAAGAYLLTALCATTLPADRLGPQEPPRDRTRDALAQALHDLATGARYLWQRRSARDALAAQTGHRFWYGLWTVGAVLLERNLFADRHGLFPGGAAGLGELVLATGVGSVTAAVLTPAVTRRTGPQRWMAVSLVGGGVGLLLLGLVNRPATLVAAAAVLGFVGQATKVCTDTIVQRSVEDAFRGRAFAFYDQVFNVAYVAAAAAGAALLPTSGHSTTLLVVTAGGYVATALALTAATASATRPAPAGVSSR